MEAIFGAVYLDAGYDKARTVILSLLADSIHQALAGEMVYDYKSRLLELIQGTRGNSTLRFVIVNEEGPVHDRVFTAAVVVDDQQIATGTGSSKKDAEQQAARVALSLLECDRNGCQPVNSRES
jgi:ribonuclease-3